MTDKEKFQKLLWELQHSGGRPGCHGPESISATPRLPIYQQNTYLHGFNQVMQWLNAAGPAAQQRFIARKLSDLLIPGGNQEYCRGQLDAINEWVRKNQTQEEGA